MYNRFETRTRTKVVVGDSHNMQRIVLATTEGSCREVQQETECKFLEFFEHGTVKTLEKRSEEVFRARADALKAARIFFCIHSLESHVPSG